MVDHSGMNWALAQAWQLAALIVVVATAVRVLARRRPHLAHVLWLVVLAKCLTPPIIASPAGIFSRLQSVLEAFSAEGSPRKDTLAHSPPSANWNEIVDVGGRAATHAVDEGSSIAQGNAIVERGVATGRIEPVAVGDRVDEPFHGREKSIVAPTRSYRWLGGLWLAGSLLFFAGAGVRTAACLRRLTREGTELHPELPELLADLRRRLRIRQRVRLLVTRSSIGPAVVGFFRPTIVLPAIIASGRSAQELEAILAHELIHIRRGDLWTGLGQVLAQGVWWFHPLVWFANRRATRASEACCDQETITGLGCDPAAYAESLLDIVAIRNQLIPVPAFPGVRPVDVTRERLERIMQIGQGCPRRTPWWCWMAMVVVAAVTLPGAAIVAGATDEQAAPSATESLPAKVDGKPPHQVGIPGATRPGSLAANRAKLPSQDSKAMSDTIDRAVRQTLGEDYASRTDSPNILVNFDACSHEKAPLGKGRLLISADRIDSAGEIGSAVRVQGNVRISLGDFAAVAGRAEIIRKSDVTAPGQPPAPDELSIDLSGGVRWASPGFRIHTDRLIARLRSDPAKPGAGMIIHELAASGRKPELGVGGKGEPQALPGTHLEVFPGTLSDRPFAKPDVRVLNLSAWAIELIHATPDAVLSSDWMNLRLLGDVKMQLSNLRFEAGRGIIAFPREPEEVAEDREISVPVSIELVDDVEIAAVKLGRVETEGGKFRATAQRASIRPFMVRSPKAISIRGLDLALSDNVRFQLHDSEVEAAHVRMQVPAIESVEPNWLPWFFTVPNTMELSGNVRLRSRAGEHQDYIAQGDAILLDLQKKSMTISSTATPGDEEHVPGLVGMSRTDPASRLASAVAEPKGAAGGTTVVPTRQQATDASSVPRTWRGISKYRLSCEKALDQDVSIHFKNAPLIDVVRYLEKLLKVDIAFSTEELESAGIRPDTRVSIDIDGVPARKALRRLLRPLSLALSHDEDRLRITTYHNSDLITTTYPVADLVVPIQKLRIKVAQDGSKEVKGAPADSLAAPASRDLQKADFSELIDLISSTIEPDTWKRAGGLGSILEFEQTLSLVIRQHPAVHDEIAELLGQLRHLRDLQVNLELVALRLPADFKPELELPIEDHDVHGAFFSDEETASLKKHAQEHPRAALYQRTQASLLNGQGFEINVPQFGNDKPPFQFVAVISADRKFVRLSLAVGAKDPIDAMSRVSTFVIPAGKSLVVDVTDELKTHSVAGLRPGQVGEIRRALKKDSGERCLLLITPRVLPPEEEELLGVDQP